MWLRSCVQIWWIFLLVFYFYKYVCFGVTGGGSTPSENWHAAMCKVFELCFYCQQAELYPLLQNNQTYSETHPVSCSMRDLEVKVPGPWSWQHTSVSSGGHKPPHRMSQLTLGNLCCIRVRPSWRGYLGWTGRVFVARSRQGTYAKLGEMMYPHSILWVECLL